MYCPSCGSEIKRGLNYCNSCGAKTIDENSGLRQTIARNFSIGLAIIGAFGLLGFVALIKSFLENGANEGLIFTITFMYLASFVSICYFMISNILKTHKVSEPPERSDPAQPQLKMPDPNKLDEYHEPAQSVVDHTTRSLDEVLVEQKGVSK